MQLDALNDLDLLDRGPFAVWISCLFVSIWSSFPAGILLLRLGVLADGHGLLWSVLVAGRNVDVLGDVSVRHQRVVGEVLRKGLLLI